MAPNKHIVLLTPGQPSSNPRLLKEAVALSKAGYTVTVLYCFWADWAYVADKVVKQRYPSVQWIEVGGNPFDAKWYYFYTRIRHRLFRWLNQYIPKNMFFAVRAELRCYPEMLQAALQLNASLYLAHNLGALAVAGRAAGKQRCAFAFDAEDFHRGQSVGNTPAFQRSVLIEQFWMPKASYVTAASPLIADAYKHATGVTATVINNVFSKQHLVQQPKPAEKLIRLFWFSQTVGKERGLEDIISALAQLPGLNFSLTLMGAASTEVKDYFQKLLNESGIEQRRIEFLDPVDPDAVFEVAQSYDIGLALEPGRDKNNQIALSNKIFTYLLAGNAVIFSATPAQKLFYEAHPEIGWLYPCGDVQALAEILIQISKDQSVLIGYKQKALQLAAAVYNWESEQATLLQLVESAVGDA